MFNRAEAMKKKKKKKKKRKKKRLQEKRAAVEVICQSFFSPFFLLLLVVKRNCALTPISSTEPCASGTNDTEEIAEASECVRRRERTTTVSALLLTVSTLAWLFRLLTPAPPLPVLL